MRTGTDHGAQKRIRARAAWVSPIAEASQKQQDRSPDTRPNRCSTAVSYRLYSIGQKPAR